MLSLRLILHSVSDSPILVEEKKWRYVFSSQTHRLLCLSPDRGKLPREGPRPSARLEHGRTLGPSPSRPAVGSHGLEACVMQSAETVVEILRARGRRGLPCERLYRQLFNTELFLMAWGR